MAKPAVRTSLGKTLVKAGRLTGAGRLTDASRLIQRAFAGFGFLPQPEQITGKTSDKSDKSEAKTTGKPARNTASRAAISTSVKSLRDSQPADAANDATLDHQPALRASAAEASVLLDEAQEVAATQGGFSEGIFSFGGDSHPYRLYVPALEAGSPSRTSPLPLIVLLHGCKQDALDFANGTAMNTLAKQNGCMVLYPEQIPASNSSRCWNWFATGHQQRDAGEPGMIAALTHQVMASRQQGAAVDAERVYIAGLSAGGAMAAVVAGLYPDIFAALGVHSGLPSGAAHGMLSAIAAMQRGAKGDAATALPTIVFHGTGDRTVHPDNGDNVSDAALAALRSTGLELFKSTSTSDTATGTDQPTQTEKTVYSAANGPSYLEHWLVEEGPHAWSGGNAGSSYTDPDGPSASAAMMAFFLQHRKSVPVAQV